jgi:hypothetical protein
MKRKSILLTIVALLFAGLASAQLNPWPASVASSKGSDTIYFCASIDSLYPIELGYDVAGKRLHPTYGDWSLYAVSDPNLTVSDYKIDAAGNVFKVVGSGIGGYIFQYKSTNVQCGLNPNETFHVYVFIMPDLKNAITEDTLVCYDKNGGTYPITPHHSFNYTDLYAKANLTLGWKNGGIPQQAIKLDSVATYVFIDTFEITGSLPAGYNCGVDGIYQLTVHVDSIKDLQPLSVAICASDTLTNPGLRPQDVFKHWTRHVTWPNVAPGQPGQLGVYTPTLVKGGNWVKNNKGEDCKIFDFEYVNCDRVLTHVSDTLVILPDHSNKSEDWGADTVVHCRIPNANANFGTISLYTLYNDPAIDYPSLLWTKPALDASNSSWHDRGINNAFPFDYGTISGGTSMNNSASIPTADMINMDDMASSIGYHYLWRPDPSVFPCIAGDSGTMVVILSDKFNAADYRVQLCQQNMGQNFDLANFTGLPRNVAKWYYGSKATPAHNVAADVLSFAPVGGGSGFIYSTGVHKLIYDINSSCGGGSATFYIKIAKTVKVPSSITEKFCIATLPATINLNEVIGIYDKDADWSIVSSGTANTAGFGGSGNGNTGIIEVGKFGNAAGQYEFKLTPKITSCFSNPVTVTIDFTNSIF